MKDGNLVQGIYPLVLILGVLRIVMYNLNFINRREIIEKSHLSIFENFSLVELGILFIMNAWTIEAYYIENFNFLIEKKALEIMILLTIIIAIKTIVKNFILLINQKKKKIWFLIHLIIILMICISPTGIGVLFIFLFSSLVHPYIHLMLIVNVFLIIEFIIIFSSIIIKKFRKKNE